MAVPWPVGLPQRVESDSFDFGIGDTTIRTKMEIGPDKVRRRMTKSVDVMSVSMILTQAQVTTLYIFFDLTVNGGVDQFVFNHPITQSPVNMRFTAPPVFNSIGGIVFKVSMNWELLS